MVTKRNPKAAKRVKNLRAKDTSAKQAKGIKGSVIAIISPIKGGGAGELLPYIEQKKSNTWTG